MRATLCLLAALTCAAVMAAPTEYLCRVSPTAATIDGALDDAVWQQASPAPGFTELGVGGGKAKNTTQVRMLMDGQALYLSLQAQTAPGATPSAIAREHDSRHWGDDCFELVLAPSPVSDDNWHFILSAAGAKWDFRRSATIAPDQAVNWNPDWPAVTRMSKGGWTAEIAIPWKSLGVPAPLQGQVWRVKLAAVAKSFPHSTWPRNESQSFGDRHSWGYLVFRDTNLVANADFEEGIPEKGLPTGFQYAYYEAEGKGICSVTDEDHFSGKYCGRLEKTDDKNWFPVFYTREIPVQPGSTYELTARVKCDRQYVMRYSVSGERGEKRSQPMPATNGWELVRQEAVIPDNGVKSITLGFQLIRTKGVILIDDVCIRRLNDITVIADAPPIPHPYHNLSELASRRSFKPCPLLQGQGGWFQSDRVIYKDSSTGIETWLLPRTAGGSTRHIYMEMSPWNADGSLLCLTTAQAGGGTMLMKADGSAWQKMPFYASSFQWDRRQPERIYFRSYRGHEKRDLWDLAVGDVLKGTFELTKRFDGDINIWPMSQDGEKLLLQERFTGDDGKPYSYLWLMDRDAKNGIRIDPKGDVHQSWFTKLPDYSVEFEWEGQEPPGQYVITTDGKVRRIFTQTAGHRAHSPNGEWIAVMEGCAIRNAQTGELRSISNEGSDHQTWQTDNNWYATSSGRYMRRVVAFGSPTTQLLGAHNSALKHSTYWSEAHPDMSHDGTKLGYASSMMGDIEFYCMVMGKPSTPQGLKATREGGNLRLTWKPGQYHKELRGYLVYRARKSGEWGEQITPEPLIATALVLPVADAAGHYRVTAVEHSSLESLPSNEVAFAVSAPANVYAEAESGKYAAPAVETFDAQAAGLYGVTLGKLRASEALTVPVDIPKAGQYSLWVRARGDGALETGACGLAQVATKQWQWVKAAQPVTLKAGPQQATLTPRAGGISVDRVLLAGDAKYQPEGLGGLDAEAPETVSGVTAEAVDSYATRLAWAPSTERDFHHYNLYCGSEADFKVGQERLIASPPSEKLVDWGLQAGKQYFYRVTSVDRSGNESAPSAVASAATPALPQRLQVALDTRWDTTKQQSVELPFTMPADGEFVVWGKVQSLDGQGKVAIGLDLDGKPLDKQSIPFGYISVGHGGPVLNTSLWHCFKPARVKVDDPMTYRADAGVHTLKLTPPAGAKVLYESFVITNYRGFLPEGTSSFRVEPTVK
ncbi:MAG: sugar-binding protein [Armatimonadota bacterium]